MRHFLNFNYNHNNLFLNSNQSSQFFPSEFFQMRLTEWNMHIFSLCFCVVHLFLFWCYFEAASWGDIDIVNFN